MTDIMITIALCWIVGFVAYKAGGNDAREACNHRTLSGDYELQSIALKGDEQEPLRTMVDNHNRILKLLCNR